MDSHDDRKSYGEGEIMTLYAINAKDRSIYKSTDKKDENGLYFIRIRSN